MRIWSDKLAAQLAKGLAPLYVIAGDEPLLSGELADAVRAAARKQGFDERESHTVVNANQFDWAGCFGGLDNLSLFATRKIVELRLPNGKPGREGGAALTALAGDPPQDHLFLIHLPKLDGNTRKTKWVTTLENNGVWVDVRAPEPAALPGWLRDRARQAGVTLETDAAQSLAARTEGNLLAAQQELDMLALLMPGETITAAHIAGAVADGARFDVYQLADAAVGQNAKRALRILHGLRREGTADALISWVLTREAMRLFDIWIEMRNGAAFGAAMRKHRIWDKQQPAYQRALRAHNQASIEAMAQRAGVTDRAVKGAARVPPLAALLELLLLIASPATRTLRTPDAAGF